MSVDWVSVLLGYVFNPCVNVTYPEGYVSHTCVWVIYTDVNVVYSGVSVTDSPVYVTDTMVWVTYTDECVTHTDECITHTDVWVTHTGVYVTLTDVCVTDTYFRATGLGIQTLKHWRGWLGAYGLEGFGEVGVDVAGLGVEACSD